MARDVRLGAAPLGHVGKRRDRGGPAAGLRERQGDLDFDRVAVRPDDAEGVAQRGPPAFDALSQVVDEAFAVFGGEEVRGGLERSDVFGRDAENRGEAGIRISGSGRPGPA